MDTAENKVDIVTEIEYNANAGHELSAVIDLICQFAGKDFNPDDKELSVNILARLMQYTGLMGAGLGVSRPDFVGQSSHVFDMSCDFIQKLENWVAESEKEN